MTNDQQETSGGELLARMLAVHGIDVLFGMGGFQLLPLYDAAARVGLRHHLINDERTGAMAADAYARVTGRLAACDGTLGPGATNLVTALAESTNAGVPVLAIIGDAHRGFAGRNMTQEARQVDILRPAVKKLIRIESAERIPELVRHAVTVALSGRPGPVVLDLPEDVSHAVVRLDPAQLYAAAVPAALPAQRPRPDADAVERAARLLRDAKRPLLVAGGGIHLSAAWPQLAAFVERHRIPVAYTLSGKGALPDTDPSCVGLVGRYTRYGNDLLEGADAVLVVGGKLGEVGTARYSLPFGRAPLIHVDASAEELGHWARTEVGIWADAGAALDDLSAALGDHRIGDDYTADVERLRAEWLATALPRYQSGERPIAMPRLLHELNQATADDAIFVADGGFAAHWSGLFYEVRTAGRRYVANRGFASIGYGLPAVIGASLAAPGRQVVGLTGDGGMNMSIGDLETARRIGASFTLVVVNNAASGYVKALQHAVYGPGRYQSSDLTEIDYASVAQAYGVRGVRVEDPDQLGVVLKDVLAEDGGPTVVDVAVTRDPANMLPGVDNRTLPVPQGS